jgi:hypothetical protein
VTGLANFYTPDAYVLWTGNAPGLVGGYTGTSSIRILYGSSIGKTTYLNATASDIKVVEINPSNENVSLDLTMRGHSSVLGNLNVSVVADQNWNYVNQTWRIASETWNYIVFSPQFPQSSTTFPQWTALKDGQNPNLVSEKSFEWHIGPYVATAVYAFMGSIVAMGYVMYRRRRRMID